MTDPLVRKVRLPTSGSALETLAQHDVTAGPRGVAALPVDRTAQMNAANCLGAPPYLGGALCSPIPLFMPRKARTRTLGASLGDRLRVAQDMVVSRRGNKKGHLLAFSKAL